MTLIWGPIWGCLWGPIEKIPCLFLEGDVPKDSTEENSAAETTALEDSSKKDESNEAQSSKPIASELIPGTSWCVVWTGDEKIFYFNPTTKISIWEKPEELLENEKLDEILEAGPTKKGQSKY